MKRNGGPHGYHWLHIPSGKSGTREFDLSHAIQADEVGYFEQFGFLPLEGALKLINQWNSSISDWKYWL